MLLDKGKVAKYLDKKRDSGVIIKLVEQLRQAVLMYQVGTADGCRSSQVDAYWVAVATTIYRQSGHTSDCKSPPTVFTLGVDGRSIESSLLSTSF